jgi:hypothetical protein
MRILTRRRVAALRAMAAAAIAATATTTNSGPTREGAPMPAPRTPERLEPDNGSSAQPQHDQAPAKPSRANAVTRIQTRAGGFIARRPTLLRVLEWLSWNNPGGGMNP